jgi:hypothetical protein
MAQKRPNLEDGNSDIHIEGGCEEYSLINLFPTKTQEIDRLSDVALNAILETISQ